MLLYALSIHFMYSMATEHLEEETKLKSFKFAMHQIIWMLKQIPLASKRLQWGWVISAFDFPIIAEKEIKRKQDFNF